MPVSMNYLVKRVFGGILIIIGAIVLSYLVIILSPGDPAVKWAGNPRGPNAPLAIEKAREELGLDDPLYLQVARFVLNVFKGDIGVSIAYKQPVFQLIYSRLQSTLELLIVAYLMAVPLGVFLGIYSALRRGSRRDSIIQAAGTILANTPTFWLATGFFLAFSIFGVSLYGRVNTRLAISTGFHPVTGFYLIDSLIQGNTAVFVDVLLRIIPPALAISVYPLGVLIRLTRTLMAEALLEDFIRTAVAWGVKRSTIIWRYALKASIPGVLQVAGLSFAYSLIDAMVVEYTVFGREGLGSLLYDALNYTDFRLATGLIIVVTVFYLVVNTLTDIVQALVDPRVKL
ncbi:binding-protein-dependent transport systems inner membrane component [Desulfurococcus mucosus DSM 2162]|uniref:Binding-protein-dependent transport systems inner membrane component n=1 Tax=Desulfurococcus mucosus (strain ATCC 35584 / DSM 2162 / JCM 9187 / O7/1) TaxID=765177 RepID=E8R9T7_DESM0|nr:binding-protein-dependent transport systems inner membrane component [Desulfurococcus mucosus DSM 2162]